MDGPLTALGWAMVVGSSIAGAWMFLLIRPFEGPTKKLMGVLGGASSMGVLLTPGICEWQKLESPYQHILLAFFVSLLGMPICRALVSVTESEAATVVKRVLLRIIGRDDPPEKKDG